jgi:hypothetical protein
LQKRKKEEKGNMSDKKSIEELTKKVKGHSSDDLKGGSMEGKKVHEREDELIKCPEIIEVMNTSKAGYPVDYVIRLYPKSVAVSLYKIGPDLEIQNRFYKELDADFESIRIKKQIEDYLKEIKDIIDAYRGVSDIETWDLMNTKDISNRMSEKGKKIKAVGRSLDEYLSLSQQLSEELTEGTQDKCIWIFCEDNEVFSLWEWIYYENSSSGERFFWGDKFLLIRVPKGYKSKKINKLIINKSLLLLDGEEYSIKQKEFLMEKLKKPLTVIPIKEEQSNPSLHRQSRRLNNKSNSGSFDAIFVVAQEASEKIQNYLTKVVKTESDSAKFVFLNTCKCPSCIFANNETMPTPWIGTSFEIDSYFSYHLAKYFYDELLNDNGKTVAEAFKEGKKRSKNLLEHDLGLKNDWRHAYVICGNPFGQVDRRGVNVVVKEARR